MFKLFIEYFMGNFKSSEIESLNFVKQVVKVIKFS